MTEMYSNFLRWQVINSSQKVNTTEKISRKLLFSKTLARKKPTIRQLQDTARAPVNLLEAIEML